VLLAPEPKGKLADVIRQRAIVGLRCDQPQPGGEGLRRQRQRQKRAILEQRPVQLDPRWSARLVVLELVPVPDRERRSYLPN
jgi:hypothetical protein